MNSDQAVALVRQELSRRSQLGHVALLMASICGGIGVASLWLTEPALPLRTHAAFFVLTVMALGWAWHAIRVLRTRAVLLALHRVRAGWLSVLCSSAFTAAGFGAWWMTGWRPGGAAALSGAVLTMPAVAVLLRARHQRSALVTRLRDLEDRA